MLTFWRKPSFLRESLAAWICALVMLAGVVQARAGTEQAAKTGFASALVLCQQNALSGDGPQPDSSCDHCRVPIPLATGALAPVSLLIARDIIRSPLLLPIQAHIEARHLFLAEARGPPGQG
jgi:hypothetical protein